MIVDVSVDRSPNMYDGPDGTSYYVVVTKLAHKLEPNSVELTSALREASIHAGQLWSNLPDRSKHKWFTKAATFFFTSIEQATLFKLAYG